MMGKRYLLIADFRDSQARFAVEAIFGRCNPEPVGENIIVLREPGSYEETERALAEAVAEGYFTSHVLVEMPSRKAILSYKGNGSYASAFGGEWGAN